MVDISIDFDNVHGVFVPGFEVTGSITFSVNEKPLKARAVIISVDGTARTNWTVSERHGSPEPHHNHCHQHDNHVGQTSTHRTVNYSATVKYAAGEAVVWSPTGGESSGHIPIGSHRFPFKFLLPPNCPPSFEGTSGYIRYFCKAKIDRPWKFDHTTRRVFTVVPTFDLNLIQNAALPVAVQESKELGMLFFKSGRINYTVRLLKGGYVPGENIVLQADIVNDSSKTISKVELKLVECSRYVAFRDGYMCSGGMVPNPTRPEQQRLHRRTVAQFEEKIEIGKGKSSQYSRMIPIPPVVPTFNICPIITVEYYVKIKITAQGTINSTLTSQLPVLIGTVPIRHFNTTAMPVPQGPPIVGMPPLPASMQPNGDVPPPSYEECVFGKGTIKDEEENKDFVPRYVYYPNISPSAPPEE